MGIDPALHRRLSDISERYAMDIDESREPQFEEMIEMCRSIPILLSAIDLIDNDITYLLRIRREAIARGNAYRDRVVRLTGLPTIEGWRGDNDVIQMPQPVIDYYLSMADEDVPGSIAEIDKERVETTLYNKHRYSIELDRPIDTHAHFRLFVEGGMSIQGCLRADEFEEFATRLRADVKEGGSHESR